MRRATVLAVSLCLATWSLGAAAQTQSDAAAEAVFEEGLRAADRGEWTAACPLFERAVELSGTEALGGMLTLADCYEHVDRPASAWSLYKRVAARGRVTKETERAAQAERAVARLEPTLPRLRFVAPARAPSGLRVRLGADVIPADVWSVPLPVDPGATTFVFEAEGRAPVTRTVPVPKGPGVTDVTAPELAPTSQPARRPTGPSQGPPSSSTTPGEGASGLGPIGIAGLVTGSVGLVAIGASAGVMASAKGDWQAAVDADCGGDPSRCRSLDGVDGARATGTAGGAVFGVGLGVAAIGTGLFVYDLVRPRRPAEDALTRAGVRVGAAIDPAHGGFSAGLAGSFR